ncbi:hypothetical protein R50073_16340 [Maricurvus nonylphenolicus]|uniref:DUF3299 domain-containing protein n=1 Tax=Maricurvus nonylphenolicus TaxID=1008307 RepID=UPI0036F4428B
MNKFHQFSFAVVATLLLSACGKDDATTQANASVAESTVATAQAATAQDDLIIHDAPAGDPTKPDQEFRELEWDELIPKSVLEVLMNPPSYVTDVEDGSLEDQISSQIKSAFDGQPEDLYQQALVSTEVVSELNNQAIKIPGFIVPLEFDDDQTITQFFLVPFFGACIHVPPPPPNQIIFVKYPQGLKLSALYDPFWIYGDLKTEITENDMATAAYSIDMQYYEAYGG